MKKWVLESNNKAPLMDEFHERNSGNMDTLNLFLHTFFPENDNFFAENQLEKKE